MTKFVSQNFLQTRGSLLLISILAMTAILAGVGAVSSVIIRELTLSKDLDNSGLALAGAEGVLEDGIYQAFVLAKPPNQINGNGTYGNGVAWQLATNDTSNEIIIDRLQKDATFQVNLYNKANPGNAASGMESLRLNSSFGHDFEFTISDWDGAALTNTRTITQNNCQNPCFFNAPLATRSHPVVIKALNGNILDLKISAWTADSGAGAQAPIPVPPTINATASLGSAKQALSATLEDSPPWL